jgi:hypothetical protein
MRIVLPSSSAGRSGAWSGRPWTPITIQCTRLLKTELLADVTKREGAFLRRPAIKEAHQLLILASALDLFLEVINLRKQKRLTISEAKDYALSASNLQ